MHTPTRFQQLSLGVVIASMALLILGLFPNLENFVFLSKVFLLFAGFLAILGLFTFYTFKRKAFELVLSPFIVPLLVFGGTVLASSFFSSPYPVKSLLGFGGLYISLALIPLFAGSLLPKEGVTHKVLIGLGASVAVLAAASIAQQLGFGPAHLLNSLFDGEIPTTQLFNISGSALVALQISILALVGLGAHAVVTKQLAKWNAVLLPLVVIAVGFFTWAILPGNPGSPALPSFAASWSVALDTIRSPRQALIGVGPANYGNVYNQFKPLWVNGTDAWAIQFIQGANLPLSLITTLGFLGLGAWLLLAGKILSQLKRANQLSKPLGWVLAASLVLQLILPPNPLIIGLQAFLLAAFIASEKGHYPVVQLRALAAEIISHPSSNRPNRMSSTPAYVASALGLALCIGLTYLTGRAFAAHNAMWHAEQAAVRNDGVAVYNHTQRAVELNPYLDSLRRSYAITNLQIATALASRTDATEQDQEQVNQLIQQAIREARSATIIDPDDTQNWQVLAEVYRSLIGVADSADQWAIQSYVRAIETSPTDPALRVALGGVFSAKQSASEAAQFYQQAINLKPDFANAYYNFAISLRQLQYLDDSLQAYQQLLTLLPEESDEAAQVQQEIEQLQELIAQSQANTQSGQESSAAPGTTDLGTLQGGAPSGPNILEQNLESGDAVVNNPSIGDLVLEEQNPDSTPPTGSDAPPETNPQN